MGLKVGVLTGTSIFGHGSSDDARAQAIFDLNQGGLDGLIMTDRVGGAKKRTRRRPREYVIWVGDRHVDHVFLDSIL